MTLSPVVFAWHAPRGRRSRVRSGDRQGQGSRSTPPPATGRIRLASPVRGLFSPGSGVATGRGKTAPGNAITGLGGREVKTKGKGEDAGDIAGKRGLGDGGRTGRVTRARGENSGGNIKRKRCKESRKCVATCASCCGRHSPPITTGTAQPAHAQLRGSTERTKSTNHGFSTAPRDPPVAKRQTPPHARRGAPPLASRHHSPLQTRTHRH